MPKKPQLEVVDSGIHYMTKEQLENERFIETWDTWLHERRLMKNPVTEAAAKLQLRFLATQVNPTAVLEQSIMNGWVGLFPTPVRRHLDQRRPKDLDYTNGF